MIDNNKENNNDQIGKNGGGSQDIIYESFAVDLKEEDVECVSRNE